MMSGDSKTLFVNRRQQLVAEEAALSSSSHHSSRADVLRNLMLMTEFARATNLMSDDACSHTFHTLADTYSYLVDSPDNGLNNYADGAFACVDGVRNETSQWKTSLRFETSQNLECVKKFLSSSKVARNFLESGAKAEDPIGWSISPLTSLNPQELSDPLVKRSVQPPVSCGAGANPGVLHPVSVQNQVQPQSSGIGIGENHSSGSIFGRRNSSESKRPMVGSAPCRSSMVRTKPMRLEDITPDERQEESQNHRQAGSSFKSALHMLAEQKKKGGGFGGNNKESSSSPASYGTCKKSLGARPGPCGKFIPPSLNRDDSDESNRMPYNAKTQQATGSANEEPVDPRLKNIEPRMIELITSEIMDHGPLLGWDDIAGLEFVKKTIKEIVIWPMLRPDIFTGLRGPPKGLLLFGPPGTGKTLIGKCIASQSKSTFFSISASSLTSKWVGESEKMVRALFAVARVQQPSVVFIDEIDSLLSQRSDGEHDSSRRIKTEFLVQLDGASTSQDDRILVVGATNRPQEIDEAARRRFVKRLYIPLPDGEARKQIVFHLMAKLNHVLSNSDLDTICDKTEGYSGADMANLCREAALGPIRSLAFQDIESIAEDEVRPVECRDFLNALQQVRASVSDKDLNAYLEWNSQFGSWAL